MRYAIITLSCIIMTFKILPLTQLDPLAELQKRADRADQSVLFFLAGANFWEKHAKNCAIMSMAHITRQTQL